ncbi:uncharacterized protein LOC121986578 [Zingiber officinale]|uniref:uncharacterized protein LOC121986578 n=1 Tax=Zingiber officinale TaxID=94328 RepID=UPI001C4B5B92|nr:uncharacterized protein LOC121986578 [Zingiber officinale]
MADASSSSSLSISSIPAISSDLAWQYGIAVEGHRSTIICVICNKTIRRGGISRLKYHLAGIEGNVEACKKVSDDVKWQMKQLINSLNKNQEQRKRLRNEIGGSSSASVNDREEPVMDTPSSTLGGSSNLNARCSSQSGSKPKLQSFFPPRTTQGAQPGIRSALATKEPIHNATMAMARWWYDANIPFNAAKSNYYQPMVDVITSIGLGFKAPSYHDLRCNLLREVVHDVNVYLLGIKKEWEVYGCSIMADGWTNQRQEPIINFLMYCPKGTMFLKSIDTSGLRKDKDTLLEIFDQVVHEVGVENVVQFITDNDASYKVAGKALLLVQP